MVDPRHSVSYTSLSTFQNCPKKYWWTYIRRLKRVGHCSATELGTALHSALERLFVTGKIEEAEDALNAYSPLAGTQGLSAEDFCRAKGILAGYWYRWGSSLDQYVVQEVEKAFNVPIPCSDYVFTGRIDLIVRDKATNRIQLWDHKTAKKLDGNYITRRWMDLQLNLYAIGAAEQLGIAVDEFVYDVMRKPEIRLKKDETLEEFGERCMAACSSDMYDRVTYPVEDMRIEETKRQLAGWLAQIEIAEACGFYGENLDHCGAYGGCPYWELCTSGGSQLIIDNCYCNREERK